MHGQVYVFVARAHHLGSAQKTDQADHHSSQNRLEISCPARPSAQSRPQICNSLGEDYRGECADDAQSRIGQQLGRPYQTSSRIERVAVLCVDPNIRRRDKLAVRLTRQDAIQTTKHLRGIIGMDGDVAFAKGTERIFLRDNKRRMPSLACIALGMCQALRCYDHIPNRALVRFARIRLICGVLSAEGVPTRRAPSGPTEATTRPPVVANASILGAISCTPR